MSEGAGLNQYNPTLPHARSDAAGIPFNRETFIINGGCSRCVIYITIYFSLKEVSQLKKCLLPLGSILLLLLLWNL